MNLTTLTAVTAQFCQDAGQSRFSGLYTQALNLAQQQFALDSKCLWKDASFTSASGTATASLPSDFMWEKKVTFDGRKLNPISRAELERIKTDTDWTTDTGTPINYIIDPEEARKQLRLYPIPQGADAGKTITLTYFPLPSDMTVGGDSPLNAYALLSQFHIGIAAWAAWYILQGEEATPAFTVKKKELYQLYNDCVTEAANTFKNTTSELFRMRGNRNYV